MLSTLVPAWPGKTFSQFAGMIAIGRLSSLEIEGSEHCAVAEETHRAEQRVWRVPRHF